jgi:hypothetical protein
VSQNHEYSLIGGINRERIGRYLALLAATISGWIVFVLLSAVDLARRLGVSVNLPPAVLSLVGAGTIFGILYWIFNRFAWRWRYLGLLLKVPDLRGEWQCKGKSLKADGTLDQQWNGTITITQSWDKLRIRLKTPQSSSNSVSAALVQDDMDGYILLYHYKNDPMIGEPELQSHRGFAELAFDKRCRSANGEYFNGHGRFTFGTLHLKKL